MNIKIGCAVKICECIIHAIKIARLHGDARYARIKKRVEMKWDKSKRSWYLWGDDHDLMGSIIYCNKKEKHPNSYTIQIHTSDGGILAIGRVRKSEFYEVPVKHIVEMALRENKDYDWWMANKYEWWNKNVVKA